MTPRTDIVEKDGSVRPAIDTGYRAPVFVPRPILLSPNPPERRNFTYLHVNDIAGYQETSVRGIKVITLDYDKIEARENTELSRRIRERAEREKNNT